MDHRLYSRWYCHHHGVHLLSGMLGSFWPEHVPSQNVHCHDLSPMVILVAGGICAWVYKADAIATVEESMQEKMKTYQPGLAEADDGTRVWDVIQETYQCCGINSHLDWSEFHTSYSNAHKRTPDSCKEASVDGNGPLHVDGCLLKVSETIRQNHWSIGGGITGVFLYLLLSICIVCMVIKNMNEEDPLIFQMNERGYDNNAMQVKA